MGFSKEELESKKEELESLKSDFEIEFNSFLEFSENTEEIDLEHISNMVSEGYTSGEGWSISIEEDENDEEIRNQEVARLVSEGYTSGYSPNWNIEIEEPENSRDVADEKFDTAKNTLDEAIKIVDELSEDDELFPSGISTLPADLRWETDLNYVLGQFDKIGEEIDSAIEKIEEKEEFADEIQYYLDELESEIDGLSFDDEQECIYAQELTSILDRFKDFRDESDYDISDISSKCEVLVNLADDEESQSLYDNEEISLFTHERNENQRIEKMKEALKGIETALAEFKEGSDASLGEQGGKKLVDRYIDEKDIGSDPELDVK